MIPLPRWRQWLPPLALILYGLILILGNIRGMGEQLLPDASDKHLHALAYGGLAALLFVGLRAPVVYRTLGIIALIAALGAVDECIQTLMPHRQADPMDWAADVLGSTAVCAVLATLRVCMPGRLRRWWRGQGHDGHRHRQHPKRTGPGTGTGTGTAAHR